VIKFLEYLRTEGVIARNDILHNNKAFRALTNATHAQQYATHLVLFIQRDQDSLHSSTSIAVIAEDLHEQLNNKLAEQLLSDHHQIATRGADAAAKNQTEILIKALLLSKLKGLLRKDGDDDTGPTEGGDVDEEILETMKVRCRPAWLASLEKMKDDDLFSSRTVAII